MSGSSRNININYPSSSARVSQDPVASSDTNKIIRPRHQDTGVPCETVIALLESNIQHFQQDIMYK